MEERSAKMKRKEELKNVLWNWEGKEIRWRINLKMIKYELIKAAFFLFNSIFISIPFSHSHSAGGWIFNTEAHPLDPGVIYCCSKKREKDRAMLQAFEEEIDLLELGGAQLEGFEEEEKEVNCKKRENNFY